MYKLFLLLQNGSLAQDIAVNQEVKDAFTTHFSVSKINSATNNATTTTSSFTSNTSSKNNSSPGKTSTTKASDRGGGNLPLIYSNVYLFMSQLKYICFRSIGRKHRKDFMNC